MSRIGIVGAGQMATALAKGLIQSNFAKPEEIRASDINEAARENFKKTTEAEAVASNTEVVADADLVILAVKPQFVPSVSKEVAGSVKQDAVVVSIAAGVRLDQLAQVYGNEAKLVRVMPNTPCLVGSGACGFAVNSNCTDQDVQMVATLLATLGLSSQVSEQLLDAITGLSGSGPAYVFEFIEALSDGGVRCGLPRNIATAFAAQTVLGAARMVLELGQHPAGLKDAVASPGGTTICGLHELERGTFRGTVMNAVVAATARAQQVGGQQLGPPQG